MLYILVYENRMNTYENNILKARLENSYIKFLDPNYLKVLISTKENKYFYKQEQIKKPKYIWSKLGCMTNMHTKDLFLAFEEDGIKFINTPTNLNISANKFLTALILKKANISFIKSLKVIGTNNKLKKVVEENFEYPVIIKSKKGSLGKGIYKIDQESQLQNLVEQINLLDKNYEYLIQEYIKEANVTYRVVVFDGIIQYVVKNKAKEDDFKSNFSQSKEICILNDVDETIKEVVEKVYRCIPLNIMGIDLIMLKNKEIKVCEINSNPGFLGVNQKGLNFEENITNFIKSKIGGKNEKY